METNPESVELTPAAPVPPPATAPAVAAATPMSPSPDVRRLRRISTVLTVLLAINLACGFYVYSSSSTGQAEQQGFHAMEQFARVLKIVRYQYVDEKKVDYERLLHGALNGMLGSLDRFSSFIPPEQFTSMNEETEGHFGGIGVVLRMVDGQLTVLVPQEGTPGQKAGLLPGDRIVAVDGTAIPAGDMAHAIDRIKGPPGSVVKLTIQRPSTEAPFDVEITRAIIQLPTVSRPKLLDGGIGYIEINQFGRQTIEELHKALDELTLQNMTGLIVDLRNNPGGLLDSAVEISSAFLPKDQLIVSTEGRSAALHSEHFSAGGPKYVRMPMVILINEGSASAAEIVAGCLKDYGRAMLVGAKTFGKGSVQHVIGLDDGSAVRLTTAHYYTPKHYVIHEQGIEPNIRVDISREDALQVHRQRSRPAGLPREDGEPADIEDVQLRQSLAYLRGLLALRPGDADAHEQLVRSLEIKLAQTATDVGAPMP